MSNFEFRNIIQRFLKGIDRRFPITKADEPTRLYTLKNARLFSHGDVNYVTRIKGFNRLSEKLYHGSLAMIRLPGEGIPICTIVDISAVTAPGCTIVFQNLAVEELGGDNFRVTVNVTTTYPPLKYRLNGGAWQDSNVFEIYSPSLTEFTFEAQDYFECSVSTTITLPLPQVGVDTTPPVTYPAQFGISEITQTSFRLNFAQADDDTTPQAQLLYKVYLTEQAPLDSLADIDSFGILYAQATGVNYFDIVDQPLEIGLFYNVTVEDAAGNRFLYAGNNILFFLEEPEIAILGSGLREIEVGLTEQLEYTNEVEGTLPTDVTWESSNEAVATVSTTGLVTAVAEGTAIITIRNSVYPTIFTAVTFETFIVDLVTPPAVLSVTVTPSSVNMSVGNYQQFHAEVLVEGNMTKAVTWSSTDVGVVTVDANGLAQMTGAGTANVVATADGDGTKTGSATVTVVAVLVTNDSVAGDLAALTELYNVTDGPNWTNNTGWLVGNPSNDWHGITVNGDGRVIDVDLFRNNMVGVLPDILGNLKWCDKFNVKHNYLTGQLPAGIGQMSRVRWLLLAGCDPATSVSQLRDGPSDYHPGKARHQTETNTFFDSVLPPEWGQLPMIELIELSQCFVIGSLPPEWSGMTTIQKLYMNGRRQDHASTTKRGFLSGTLPASWSALVNLTAITLNNHPDLTGPLPPEWSTWTQMRYARLGRLNLAGTSIPTTWETWSDLRLFAIGGGKLTGEIPAWILDDRSLRLNTLDLAYNLLTSMAAVNYANVTKTAPGYWVVGWNTIGPTPFPNFVKQFKNMILFGIDAFGIYNNQFNGAMDDDFFVGWNRLRNFNMAGQAVGGTLPSSFGDSYSSASTQRLGWNSCGFVGKIPATYANYRTNGTYWFYLSGNDLEGIVPVGMSDWRSRTTWNITVDTTNNRINHTDNPFINGNILYFESTGANPGGLLANTKYYIVNRTASNYQVSLTEGGSPVNITSVGSGTISVRKNAWLATQNGLRLHSNRFTYSDLMPIINAWPTNVPLTYQTQKEFPVNDYQNPTYARTTGQTATFDLSGIHVAGNTYQWRKDGVNLNTGGRIIGATSNILQITNVGISDNGLYTVRILNPNAPQLAESISQPITLTVT